MSKGMNFNSWFMQFLEEKDLPYASWEIKSESGAVHQIDSGVVIEAIRSAGKEEQAAIKVVLVKLDFMNGNIHHFFKHLATGLVNDY